MAMRNRGVEVFMDASEATNAGSGGFPLRIRKRSAISPTRPRDASSSPRALRAMIWRASWPPRASPPAVRRRAMADAHLALVTGDCLGRGNRLRAVPPFGRDGARATPPRRARARGGAAARFAQLTHREARVGGSDPRAPLARCRRSRRRSARAWTTKSGYARSRLRTGAAVRAPSPSRRA